MTLSIFAMYILLVQTTTSWLIILLINDFTTVHGPTMPPVGFEPMTPVHVLAMDHARQQVP